MSMGPNEEELQIKTAVFDRVTNIVKKTTELYFENPLHYLFYTTLLGMVVALLLNKQLPWQLYFATSVFGTIQLYRYFLTHSFSIPVWRSSRKKPPPKKK